MAGKLERWDAARTEAAHGRPGRPAEAPGDGREQDKMKLYLKDPQARIDHEIDWSAYLAGQHVAASAWEVNPIEAGGMAVEADAFEDRRTSVRLSGGAVGKLYRVTNRVTLSDGQVDERSIHVRVEER